MPVRPSEAEADSSPQDPGPPQDQAGPESLPQSAGFPGPERLPRPQDTPQRHSQPRPDSPPRPQDSPQPERLPHPEDLPRPQDGPQLERQSQPEDVARPGGVPLPKAQPARRPCADTGHPILVGFDGSPASHNALAYATGMARRLAEPLLIVHVAPPGIFCEPLTGMVVGSVTDREHMNRWLRAELLAACDIQGLDVRMVTRSGTPARELAAAATEYSADALIIGASGRPWRHLAGSVSTWLARHAQCPVIVVP